MTTTARAAAHAPGQDRSVAYFSMEIAIADALPTFSGGLGVLAGDYLLSAADLAAPITAVTLCYRGGYFAQHVDARGQQHELPVVWSPESHLEPLTAQVSIELFGREVRIGAWRYRLIGYDGAELDVVFLDTDVEGNDDDARSITDRLYGGDEHHRLAQEAVLGLGGVAMLAALGIDPVTTYHLNEGHSAFLTLALLQSELQSGSDLAAAVAAVRDRCAFTTHTPVPAGHDRFETPLVEAGLGHARCALLGELGLLEDGWLNMTELSLALSGFANAVSLRHGEVSREMFPHASIRSVTNGVHVGRWAAPSVAALFDRHLPGWRGDNSLLRYAGGIELDELDAAHRVAKAALLGAVAERSAKRLDPDALTIGLARRATPYKQTALVFSDLDRLRAIAEDAGPLQVICSGKAHPRDEPGKELIARIVAAAKALEGAVDVVFLEDYDLELAALLVGGSDLWLNNPVKPHEASGTSGMKAALNGVPSLSVLDGWWIEGCVEGVTGWAIGDHELGDDAELLYAKLGDVVAPLYRTAPAAYLEVMRQAIALNGSFFNTERMVREYATAAYDLSAALVGERSA